MTVADTFQKENVTKETMHNRRDILAIAAFLILILVIWTGILALPSPGLVELSGYDGFYDFSDVNFTDTIYAYNGNWKSYPEKLYTPEDFDSGKVTEQAVLSNTLDYSRVQYATHTMEVALPAGQVYGLFMRTADYSMRLFVNGKEMDCVGLPGESAETTTPRVLERIYAFVPETDITSLIMQTANFVHREGAFAPRFVIGDYLAVQRRIGKDNLIAVLVTGCLLSALLYHLSLYVLDRKRINSLLFALSCFWFAMLPKNLVMMFEGYNWQIAFRVEYLSHYAVFTTVLLFLDNLHSGALHKTVVRGYYVFAGLFIIGLALPTTVFTRAFIVFEVVSIAIIVYVIAMLTHYSINRRKIQNFLSLAGLAVTGLFGLNDILMRFGIIFLGLIGGREFTSTIGMMFFVSCYSLVISLEYADTERRENKLAAERMALEVANQLKNDLMLQPKEFALLLLLMQNEGKVMSAEELYGAAWNAPMAGDKSAVQMTVSRLRKKIEPTGYSIQSLYGKGYVFSCREE